MLGVRELLEEWTAFRRGMCPPGHLFRSAAQRRKSCTCSQGLKKILLDIDKAVKIVRETEEEVEVVPNLMIGFGIDEVQAEYVAEIKLRHLNREYILKRTEEIESLTSEIAEMEDTLKSPSQGGYHHRQSAAAPSPRNTASPAAKPRCCTRWNRPRRSRWRKCRITPCGVFFTREGYFKKITPQSLRMSGEQKLKEGDAIAQEMDTTNSRGADVLSPTCGQVYKSRAAEFRGY